MTEKNQSTNQPTNQPINQSINLSIYPFALFSIYLSTSTIKPKHDLTVKPLEALGSFQRSSQGDGLHCRFLTRSSLSLSGQTKSQVDENGRPKETQQKLFTVPAVLAWSIPSSRTRKLSAWSPRPFRFYSDPLGSPKGLTFVVSRS